MYGPSNICMNIYGASDTCMDMYGPSNICMNSYRASDICMDMYGPSNICRNCYGASSTCMTLKVNKKSSQAYYVSFQFNNREIPAT